MRRAAGEREKKQNTPEWNCPMEWALDVGGSGRDRTCGDREGDRRRDRKRH